MARAAKKRSANKGAKDAPETLKVRVSLDPSEDTPFYYVNYAEIVHSINDFVLVAARLPPKPSMAMIEEARETGVLRVEPAVQLVMSPALIPGLIRALTIEREKYEKEHGPLKDAGENDERP